MNENKTDGEAMIDAALKQGGPEPPKPKPKAMGAILGASMIAGPDPLIHRRRVAATGNPDDLPPESNEQESKRKQRRRLGKKLTPSGRLRKLGTAIRKYRGEYDEFFGVLDLSVEKDIVEHLTALDLDVETSMRRIDGFHTFGEYRHLMKKFRLQVEKK